MSKPAAHKSRAGDTGDSVLSNIAHYSASQLYRQVLGIANAFIRPKLLTPQLYGLWHLLALIIEYASFSDLGSRTSMRYLIPFNQARGEDRKNEEIKSCGFFGSLYIPLLMMPVLLCVAVFGDFRPEVRWGLVTVSAIILIRWYHGYYVSLLKSLQNFRLVARASYVRSSVAVFLGIILIYYWRIYGVYVSAIASYLAAVLYFRYHHRLSPHVAFNFSLFRKMVKQGFPVMLFNLFDLLIRSSDRLIVASFLGLEELGYYGIVGIVFSFLMQVPGASRDVIEPRLMERLDPESRKENISEYLFKPLLNTAFYFPFLVGAAYFCLPPVIHLILPRYSPGIVPAQILIVGSYFLAMAYVTRGMIVANNWQVGALVYMTLGLAANVSFSLLFIRLGFGLNGVALGSGLSFLVIFAGLLKLIRNGYRGLEAGWGMIVPGLLWPFIMMVCLLFLAGRYLQTSNVWTSAIAGAAVYFPVMLFVLTKARRRFPLLKQLSLKDLFRGREAGQGDASDRD